MVQQGNQSKTKLIAKIAAVGLVYLVVGKLGLRLAVLYPSASAVWPGTGLTIGAFLIFGYEVWPGILLGAFFTNLLTAGSLLTSVAIGAGNTLEGLAGAFLIFKYANGREAFRRAEDVFKFALLAAVASTTISATIGTGSLYLAGFTRGLPQSRIWLTWWLGDVVGALVVTPCVVLWSQRSPYRLSRKEAADGLLAFASLMVVGVILFGGVLLPPEMRHYPLSFLCIPLVVWGAFHLRPREAAGSVIALSVIAVWGTLRGFGGFAQADRNLSLLLLQTFMSVVSMTSMVLCAVIWERKEVANSLQRAKGELESKVAERTETLRELTARLLQIRDEEGRRIARELHDSTAQALAAVCMNLGAIRSHAEKDQAAPAGLIAETNELVRGAMNEVRTVSYLLHPPMLDELGLRSALRVYIDGFTQRSGIQVEQELPAELGRLPADLETAVFRVVQECLTNVHRHSGSAKAAVRIGRVNGHVTIEVEDEGKGMPAEMLRKIASSNSPGVGLRGMRERIQVSGGKLEVVSDGKGTKVRAEVPVHGERK
jgi:signal transduction histidine kinase